MLLVLHPFSQNLPHEKWSKPRKPHPKLPRKGHYRMCLGTSEGFFQGVTKNAFFQKWETVVQFHFLTAKSRKTFFCLKRKQQFIKFQGEQGRRQQEGQWCPAPHFMFAPPGCCIQPILYFENEPPLLFLPPGCEILGTGLRKSVSPSSDGHGGPGTHHFPTHVRTKSRLLDLVDVEALERRPDLIDADAFRCVTRLHELPHLTSEAFTSKWSRDKNPSRTLAEVRSYWRIKLCLRLMQKPKWHLRECPMC